MGHKINDSSILTNDSDSTTLLPLASATPQTCTVGDIYRYFDLIVGSYNIEAYSDTGSYVKNKIVQRNGSLYRFVADKSAGAWDANKVVETNLCYEFESVSGEYETVTVTVTVSDSGFSTQGVTVACAMPDGTATATTDSNGQCTFTVSIGEQYTLSVNDKLHYYGIVPKTYLASSSARSVTIAYVADTEDADDVENVSVLMTSGSSIGAAAITGIEGEEITIAIGSETKTATLDSSGWAYFTVPQGSTYTVFFPTVTGYVTPQCQTFTAVQKSRVIKSHFAYYYGDDDVLVACEDGNEYTIAAYQRLTAKPTAIAIHVASEELCETASGLGDGKMCDFYFPVVPYVISGAILSASATITNMTTTTTNNTSNAASCHYQYTGSLDTKRLKDFVLGSAYYSVPWKIMAYRFDDYLTNRRLVVGDGDSERQLLPFFPAFGQLWACVQRIKQINALLNLCNQYEFRITTGTWWSVTQYSAANMWYNNAGAAANTTKTTSCSNLVIYN